MLFNCLFFNFVKIQLYFYFINNYFSIMHNCLRAKITSRAKLTLGEKVSARAIFFPHGILSSCNSDPSLWKTKISWKLVLSRAKLTLRAILSVVQFCPLVQFCLRAILSPRAILSLRAILSTRAILTPTHITYLFT